MYRESAKPIIKEYKRNIFSKLYRKATINLIVLFKGNIRKTYFICPCGTTNYRKTKRSLRHKISFCLSDGRCIMDLYHGKYVSE